MLHDDLVHQNIVWGPNGEPRFIDLEDTRIGDPAEELAYIVGEAGREEGCYGRAPGELPYWMNAYINPSIRKSFRTAQFYALFRHAATLSLFGAVTLRDQKLALLQ